MSLRGRGNDLRGSCAPGGERQDRQSYGAKFQGLAGAALLKSNWTFGGVSEPAVAVK